MHATSSLSFVPPDFMALIIFVLGARTAHNIFHCNMLHFRYPKKGFLDVFSLNMWAQLQAKCRDSTKCITSVV